MNEIELLPTNKNEGEFGSFCNLLCLKNIFFFWLLFPLP